MRRQPEGEGTWPGSQAGRGGEGPEQGSQLPVQSSDGGLDPPKIPEAGKGYAAEPATPSLSGVPGVLLLDLLLQRPGQALCVGGG